MYSAEIGVERGSGEVRNEKYGGFGDKYIYGDNHIVSIDGDTLVGDKEQKEIRLVELFAGIGAQAMALRNLGIPFKSIVCEIDEKAYKSYCAIHGETPNLGDITKVEHLPECDLLTYSFPCGPRGTKISTEKGYKSIENIVEGDLVLTHNNRYKKVIRTMSRITNKIYKIKAVGTTLRLTENHPLYVYRNGNFEWVKVKDLEKNDELVYNIPQKEIDVPYSKEYMWLFGRYVADGFVNKYLHHSTEFAIGISKAKEFDAHIPLDLVDKFKACNSHPTCLQYRIADAELQKICLEFGNGSSKKHIPQWVIDLPKEKLQSFFDGYMSGDGHIRYRGNSKQIMFSTVSEELFLGLQMVVAKLYGKICSLYIRHDHRRETFNDGYSAQLSMTNKSINQTVRGDKITVRVRSVEEILGEIEVFNFEVEDDNSYTTNNIIVHNCQDISLAGRKKGFTKGENTRSGLLWEVERLLLDMKERGCLPDTLLMENVDAIINENNMPDFNKWIESLSNMGYTSTYQVMNAKDYGVPQNRKRCFMVSCLNGKKFKFPKPCPDGRVLRDVLEKDVPESYYLSDEKVAKYEAHGVRHAQKGNGFGWEPTEGNEAAHSVTTSGDRNCGNYILEPKVNEDTGMILDGNLDRSFVSDRYVYSADGMGPTLLGRKPNCNARIRCKDEEQPKD